MEDGCIILGIDPGTTVMGYGVIRILRNQPELVVMGTLAQKKRGDHYGKISSIFTRTLQLIDEYKPGAMAIEAPFYGNNIQSMLKLGRAQGAAISAALYRQVQVFEYAPRRIKQSITGYGNASKEQVALLLQKSLHFGMLPDDLDATDGLAAAMCHFYQQKTPGVPAAGKSWKDFIRENPGRVQ